MAIALPLLAHVFEPVQAMVQWLSGGAPARHAGPAHSGRPVAPAGSERHRPPRPAALPRERSASAACPALAQRAWGGPTRSGPLQRPLRVVRVIDHRSDREVAGRMVISGRMADVCAELDRLAALETRH